MSKDNKLAFLFPDTNLKETVQRFKIPVVFSLLLFIWAVLETHDLDIPVDEKVSAVLVWGFFLTGALTLMWERAFFSKAVILGGGLISYGVIAAVIFISPLWGIYLCFLSPALLLFLVTAPYIDKKSDDFSFWFYNRKLWVGAFISFVTAGILMGGAFAVIASIKHLFGVDIPDEIFTDLWLFTSIVFAPIYALSWVPTDLDTGGEKEAENYTDACTFIANWILTPLIWTYFLILYAYAVKILLQWELPNGYLAVMMTTFAGVGVFLYLMAWPIRNTGTRFLKFFYKYFFLALSIPLFLLYISVYIRIEAYGITEQRYALILGAIWFTFISVLYALRPKTPIKIMPLSLCILFVLSAFGPWGAVSLSGKSQLNRLETVLIENGLLQNGKIVEATEKLDFDVRKNISSIVQYIYKTEREDEILEWLGGSDTEKPTYAGKYVEALGFDFVSKYSRRNAQDCFNVVDKRKHDALINISGYDLFVQDTYYSSTNEKHLTYSFASDENASPDMVVTAKYEEEKGFVVSFKGDEFSFDLEKQIRDFDEESQIADKTGLRLTALSEQGAEAGLDISRLYGCKKDDGQFEVRNMSFILLLQKRHSQQSQP